MAGGGIGVPASTTDAAKPAVPAGAPLDGSPKFEAATPVSANPTPTPSVTPVVQPGTSFMGVPSWLAQWTGAHYGGSAGQPSTLPNNYKPYIPGTPSAVSGYGGPRTPQTFMPPPKPTTAPVGTSNVPSSNYMIMADGSFADASTGKPLDADQQNMIRWMQYYNRNQGAPLNYNIPGGN